MSCPVAWSDRDGVHTCRHTQGHPTRRHTCECGSAADARDSQRIESPHVQHVALSPCAVGEEGGTGRASGEMRPVSVAT